MNLYQMLHSLTWPDVKASLVWNYTDTEESLDAYRLVLAKLKILMPGQSQMRIVVRKTFREGLDEEPFWEVVGRNGQLNREQEDFKHLREHVDSAYANTETDFSLALESWENWIGMRIDTDTLNDHPKAEIAAHCLWEMTFHGFDQSEIQAEKQELIRRVEELKAMSEEEKKEKLIPMEEVKKRLGL